MHRDDRLRAGGDAIFNQARIHIEGLRTYVREHGGGAEPGDRSGGGEECERDRDDFVALPDSRGRQ